MKKTALATILLLLLTAGMSYAYSYATDVRWDSGSGATPAENGQRYDQDNALGSPDDMFLSLGRGGMAVFDFGTDFFAELIVFETTYGNRSNYMETANVYVATSAYDFSGLDSTNGGASISTSDFTLIGDITNLLNATVVDLSSLTGTFRYLLIEDTTTYSGSPDGFDVNAVGVAPVPEPATLVLLGSGLVGLFWYNRKRTKA